MDAEALTPIQQEVIGAIQDHLGMTEPFEIIDHPVTGTAYAVSGDFKIAINAAGAIVSVQTRYTVLGTTGWANVPHDDMFYWDLEEISRDTIGPFIR